MRTAGIGFKPQHLEQALGDASPGLWLEVHAENYMVAGGPRLAMLDRLRAVHPLSLHCVGMSLAAIDGPDPRQLDRLKALVDRIDPVAVSDHLAWTGLPGAYQPDFLPLPRSAEALAVIAANVARIQDVIGRPMLVENPSTYVDVGGHAMPEADFLEQLCRRTGCGLLVDVNNLAVSAANVGLDAPGWIAAIDPVLVGEVHIAGHEVDARSGLLIDSHAAAVSEGVWLLLERLLARTGPVPVLLERDGAVPAWDDLRVERDRAHAMLACATVPA